jgi:fatty acid desaturase
VRSAILAAAVGLGAALYFAFWFHWPTFLAVGVGAFMAIVLLMIASSLGEDPAAADAAWREASPDLARPGTSESPGDSTTPKPP